MGYNESAHRSAGSKLSFSKNWDERIQLVIIVFMRFRQVRVGSTGEADLLRSNFAASMIVNPPDLSSPKAGDKARPGGCGSGAARKLLRVVKPS